MYAHLITAIFCITILFASRLSHAVVINEIRIDQTGADTDEYFELSGLAGETLDNLSYLVIGDQSDIEVVVDLSGYQIAADGFFLVAESSFSLHSDVNLLTSLNFENNDNVTHMLVSNFSGSLHDDIDADNDGIFDNAFWTSIVDSVALVANSSGGDRIYSNTSIGPKDGTSPAHVYRNVDGTGAWLAGESNTGITDSPRLARPASRTATVPEPSSLMLLLPGILLLRFRHNRKG